MRYDVNSDRWAGGFKVDRLGGGPSRWMRGRIVLAPGGASCKEGGCGGAGVAPELLVGAELHGGALAARGPARARSRCAPRRSRFTIASSTDPARPHASQAARVAGLIAENSTPSRPRESRARARGGRRPRARRVRRLVRAVPALAEPTEPGAHGTFATRSGGCPRSPRSASTCVYLPPIHPIGTTHRKGRNNTLAGRARTTWAARGRSATRAAATPRSTRARHARRLRALRRSGASELGLEIALDYALQCSPDHPWVQGASGVVLRPARRHDPLRRESARRSTRTSTRSTSGATTARRSGTRAATSCSFWIEHGVRIFRVDNPHTKPFAFWEWVIAEVQRDAPRRRLPRRGVHAPEAHEGAGEARASRSRTRTSPGGTRRGSSSEYLTELTQHARWPSTIAATSSRTRRTSCTSICRRRPPGVSRAARCWPPRCRRSTASTAASSCARTCRCAPAARSISTPRSTRLRPRDWQRAGQPQRRHRGASTPSAARTRRCSAYAISRSTRPRTDDHLSISKVAHARGSGAIATTCRRGRRLPRPAPHHAGRMVARAARATRHRPATMPYVVEDLLTGRALHLARRAQLRPARSGRTSRTYSPARAAWMRAQLRAADRPSSPDTSGATRTPRATMTRQRSALVQGRDHLSAAHQDLSRLRRRRLSATSAVSSRSSTTCRQLGVNTIWLLPFYPSPLGTTATTSPTYEAIHPTLRHDRGLPGASSTRRTRADIRVITELVINHTSDQHPWFQRARAAPEGSPRARLLRWSDDPTKYPDARIIFTDTENVELGVGSGGASSSTGTASSATSPT